MPSTYSPSLRLELIGDGEQDGIWGQTTNNNFGELVEQAIAGITTVDVTASNVVLTSFNGAVDEARSSVLNVSGTPGVTRDVIIPNYKKTYLVKNTSDASVGIKTASGSPATVASNGQSLMVCDGLGTVTNYLESAVITPPFPAGTRLLFQQTTAPTGWTKITTYNDAALRVVSGAAGTGGSVGFTTAFASKSVTGTVGNTTLTIDQIPNHSHGLQGYVSIDGGGSFGNPAGSSNIYSSTFGAGGGQSHTHTFTGTAINLAVQYVDIIIASKD
jgi:hypothetical protein